MSNQILKSYWKLKNKKRREYRHKYYLQNKERQLSQVKKWQKDNKEKVYSYIKKWNKKYRKRGRYPRCGRNRLYVYERDNYTCQICKKKYPYNKLDIHHIDNHGRHDTDNGLKVNNQPTNLQTLCKSCHGRLHRLQYLGGRK